MTRCLELLRQVAKPDAFYVLECGQAAIPWLEANGFL